MHKKIITANEANQRLDKFLHKYLPEAGNSFIYKMLRKKNIVLNGKKAFGSEKIAMDDEITFFISDETLSKFRTAFLASSKVVENFYEAYRKFEGLSILFENEHLLAVDKPVGLLCQKAKADDVSLNDWLIGYLLFHHTLDKEGLNTFLPSILNRLDRNTSGIVLCGKTLLGSQELSRMLKEHQLHKYYQLIVKGNISEAGTLSGYHHKDEKKNKVKISPNIDGASSVITKYRPLKNYSQFTRIEAELITGKTHQIRAGFAAIGHPLIGDYKYGDRKLNDEYKLKIGIKSQLLHASQITFPQMSGSLCDLNEMQIVSPTPHIFDEIAGI